MQFRNKYFQNLVRTGKYIKLLQQFEKTWGYICNRLISFILKLHMQLFLHFADHEHPAE